MASADVQRRLSLIQELEVSLLALDAGLRELHGSLPYRTRYFVILLLLSTGIERLLKVVLHLHALEATGVPVPLKTMRKTYGHNLVALCSAVARGCFSPEYLARPAAAADLAFIQRDPLFRPLLRLLCSFAGNDRYVFMNAISEPGGTAEWPERRWQALEAATWPPGEFARRYVAGHEQEAKAHANRALVACVERFLRALARLFTLGPLGGQGRQVSSLLHRYLMLTDEDLGTMKYRT